MAIEDKVNEILGLEPAKTPMEQIHKEEEFKAPVVRTEEKDNDVDNDHKNSREHYYNLIEKGQEAIEGILNVAKEGQHPRAYEVALAGIKNVADTVDKLQDLNKKLKDLKELPKTANTNIKNALFVGSTNELQKMLNRKDDEVIEGTETSTEQDNTGTK
jgi:hypothetical protein